MINLTIENIVKALIKEIKALLANVSIYLGNLEENSTYPCILINLGLNTSKVLNTDTLKKNLTVDLIYFNSNKIRDQNDFIETIKVRDILEQKLLNKHYISILNKEVNFNFDITKADDLLDIVLKITYFNELLREEINYEKIEEIVYTQGGK